MRGIFITGTDTAVGKSIVSGLLGRYLWERGYKAITQKWVQTGGRRFSPDIALHLRLMKRKGNGIKNYLPHTCCYNFKFASSPHLAARLANRKIDAEKIKRSFKFLTKNFDFVIVEGIGGALVPYDGKDLLIDIAKKLSLPILVVADNKLGAINHTLLTIEAIKNRNMRFLGIIFNSSSKGTNKIILKDNPQIVKGLTNEAILGILPYENDNNHLYKRFRPIGKNILACLKGEK